MRLLAGPVIAALACLPAIAAPEAKTLERADGSLIHYTIDRPHGTAAGLVVLAQGSGCRVGASNPAIGTVRAAFAHHSALIVEKIGVTPEANIIEGTADCPAAFVDGYTMTQRVADYEAVISYLRGALEPGADRLVLYGGSEGGLAVAKLAAKVDPVATIVMSSGTGLTVEDLIKSTLPPEGRAALDAGFTRARANPDSSDLFAGSSYRYWADILDERVLDYLLASTSPILLIQGGRDLSNPPLAARLAANAFAEAGDCRLTYWEFPALDHGMLMPNEGSRLHEVAKRAADWVRNPLPAC